MSPKWKVGGYALGFLRSDDELADLAPGTFQLSSDWPWSGLTAVLKAWLIKDRSVLAWLRRIIVSLGIGGASYATMLIFMVLSVIYDRQFEPIITFAFDTGRWIVDALDSWVAGNRWGQIAVNHLRERVNMTHVVLSIPAIILATLFVGIPLNKLLGGTRTAMQRMAIAVVSVPATVMLAIALFTFNALVPETYAALLRFADWVWQGSLNVLASFGDSVPEARKLTNVARQGFSGHHYVIMALCSALAAFLVNALFASAAKPRQKTSAVTHYVGRLELNHSKINGDDNERDESRLS